MKINELKKDKAIFAEVQELCQRPQINHNYSAAERPSPCGQRILRASQASAVYEAYLRARHGGAATGKKRHDIVGDKIGVGGRIAFDSGE